MWKKILLIQFILCIIISCGYLLIEKYGSEGLQNKQQQAVAAVSKHNTVSDLWDKGKQAASVIVKAPVAVTSYIIASNEEQKYGVPIDETETGETVSVYAVSGGQVIETGEDSQLGKYVKISHNGDISVYGRCTEVYVKAGEHVRAGHIIASFEADGNSEFYYDLIEE